MGDRANIAIEKDEAYFPSPVYFYTHWDGSDITSRLKSALIRGKSRWNDGQYLARVIFCDLLDGDTDITGFGISTKCGDGDDRLLCVNIQENKVRYRHAVDGPPDTEWTFEEFINDNSIE